MKDYIEISRTPYDGNLFVEWKKTPLISYYDRLDSYINSRPDFYDSSLLSRPKIQDSNEGKIVVWYSNKFNDVPSPLSKLNQKTYNRYKELLLLNLDRLGKLVKDIKETSRNKAWAEMIELAINNVNEDFVFCGNGEISIAYWGVRIENSKERVPLIRETERGESEKLIVKNESKNEGSKITIGKQNLNDDKEKHKGVNNVEEQTDSLDKPEVLESKRSRKNYLYYAIPFLLLLVSGIFLKNCKTVSPKVTDSLLPDKSREIIPFDPSELEMDVDSVRTVIGTRLNIALKNKEDKLEDFAREFKKQYQSSEIEIIYFDTLTKRIQIKVPSAERTLLKKEIPEKLKGYKLLIWEEGLFRNNKIPSDPEFANRNHSWYLDAVKVEGIWDKTFGDEDILVAVIDDGFDLTHEELKSKFISPLNTTNNTSNVFTNQDLFHGTHVAGTIIAEMNNAVGLSGVAPNCNFIPIQVSDSNGYISSTAVIDAILYALNKEADVINISLGLMIDPMVSKFPKRIQRDLINHSYKQEEEFWNQIFQMAESNGSTIVIAAGNENMMVGIDPRHRSPLGIKVNAINSKFERANFSNYGYLSTVSAPGTNIYSCIPQNDFKNLDGTSMAAPIVTGAIALIKSIDNTLSTKEIIKILQSTGRSINSNDKEVGPLIQLNSLYSRITDGFEVDDCGRVQESIDELYRRIEKLKNECPDFGAIGYDTMRMPQIIDDTKFTIGRWMSTTQISNDDEELVTLYFDFNENSTGKFTLAEPNGTNCISGLNLSVIDNELLVKQANLVSCSPQVKSYNEYRFNCIPDNNGYALCVAQNVDVKANRFEFNMVRIK